MREDDRVNAFYPDNGDGDPAAVPGVHPGHEGAADAESFTLEVDGEVFAVSPNECGGTHYTWLSGPNPGYGFGVSQAVDLSPDAHARHVRDFLALVGPAAGYIEDD
jgi:hypothetical protein